MVSAAEPAADVTVTRNLLTAGLVAGPIYVAVGAFEMLLRPGFDIRRHSLSVVANGDWGWIHILMMATTGVLTVAGAIGMARAMRGQRAGTWGPILVGVYGLGITCAAFFTADPTLGFPPGTPADARAVSWHGLLHLLFGSVGFLGLIAACLVFARRFASLGQRRLAAGSVFTGVFFFAAFAGIASSGTQTDPSILALIVETFTAAVVVGWAWLSTVSAVLERSVR
jgi:hypothetical protein